MTTQFKYQSATATNPVATFTEIESKSDKFIRLATARTNKAIYYLDKLASLATRSKGAYTPEQVNKIIQAIDIALNGCEQKLLGTEPKPQPFSLKGE